MSIQITSTGTLRKGLAVKCETRDDKSEVVVCTLGLSRKCRVTLALSDGGQQDLLRERAA